MKPRILIVDDEQSMCELLDADLRLREFDPVWRTSAEEALQLAVEQTFDVVLTDLKMPGVDGIQLCRRLTEHHPDVPVVVMTAFGSMETAIAAIRAGAYDFVTKPIEMDMLALTLQRAVKHRQLQQKVKVLSEAVQQAPRFEEMLGESPPMQELYDQLGRIADSEASVLITGESGTGKELVARSMHQNSRRSGQPFVAVNCAALPETLLESELFGHAKGRLHRRTDRSQGPVPRSQRRNAFAGRDRRNAHDDAAQAAASLGGTQSPTRWWRSEEPFDVRVLTATNRDLESAVEEGDSARTCSIAST